MQKPASLIRITLRKCPSAVAPRGEVLRWHSGVKGLQQRSHEVCTTQTDYRRSALTLDAAGGGPLGELLGAPLLALNQETLRVAPAAREGRAALPFSIAHHPEAQSINAKSSLTRLAEDYSKFFQRPLQQVSLVALGGGGGAAGGAPQDDAQLAMAEEALRGLKARLVACGAQERALVAQAHADLMRAANEQGEPSDAGDGRVRFALLRHSGHESPLWFEYIVGCLLSSRATSDLQKLNPFVSAERWGELLIELAVLLLRSNRVVQANAASEACDAALTQLGKVRAALRCGPLGTQAALELQLKLDALCTLVMTQRAYAKSAILKRAEAEHVGDGAYLARLRGEVAAGSFAGAEAMTVDPRFLAFEFLWSLQLRARQVDLVLECVDAALQGGSIVKQMIMGAGKTSVVSPLICLMLAQGEYLVLQCVPPALLPMSFNVLQHVEAGALVAPPLDTVASSGDELRDGPVLQAKGPQLSHQYRSQRLQRPHQSGRFPTFDTQVLRTTFSSAIQKRVYTFQCERSTSGKRSLHAKLLSARQNSSVVITTPAAVKSLMLKFVENLTVLTDDSSSRYKERELRGETHVWGEILELFRAGVCIMDEVDWVLHPLKSELNFPIGEKSDLHFTKEGERWRLPTVLFDVLLFAQECEQGAASLDAIPRRLTLGSSAAEVAAVQRPLLALIVAAIRAGFEQSALQRLPHMVLLREDFYEEPQGADDGRSLKQLLGSWLLGFLRSHLELASPPTGSCTLDDKQILEYISSAGPYPPELRAQFGQVAAPGRRMLNLAADWLNQFLPHALRKIDRVTFGIMNEGTKQPFEP